MTETFAAMILEEVGCKPQASIREISRMELPNYDVLVEVGYSSLNYKDGLAISGRGRIARRLPMVAGIDLAGTVVESGSTAWQPGDKVVLNGWGLSETEWGGYSRYQRVKPEWLIQLPEVFTLKEAMAIGTAGYTAALCVNALERWGLTPGKGEVLVTGAAGGVGSTAISLLAAKGYDVVASTGRAGEARKYLEALGARALIDRSELSIPGKPLQKERWSGTVDTVGSATLSNVIAQMVYGGAVAACGLAGGHDLPGTVFPHILRSVALIGVDSVYASREEREKAWKTLANHLDPAKLALMTRVEPMNALPELARQIVDGKVRGRVVIEIG